MNPLRIACAPLVTALICQATAAPPSQGNAQRPQEIGMHFHKPEALRAAMPNLPIGSIRLWDTRTHWNKLEAAPGVWDFRRLDEFVELSKANNLKILLVLGQTPKWAASRPDETAVYGDGAASMPKDLGLWADYVRTVVRRYKGRIEAYEVMNEPKIRGPNGCNGVVFFCGSTEDLVKLAQATRVIVRSEDPFAKVVSPSFSGGDLGLRASLDFLDKGGAAEVDVVAFHFYDTSPQAMAKRAAALRDALASRKLTLPIWNTEVGFYVQRRNRSVQANAGVGWGSRVLEPADALDACIKINLLLLTNGVARTYWYAWDSGRMGFDEVAAEATMRLHDLATMLGPQPGKVQCKTSGEPSQTWVCESNSGSVASWPVRWPEGRVEWHIKQ